MSFDRLIDTWAPDGDLYAGTAPKGWSQGRAVFGGIPAAAALRLARRATDRPIRTAQLQFLAPLAPGPMQGRVERLREGRSATMIQVRIEQEGAVKTTGLFTFVQARPGTIEIPAAPAPQAKPPEAYPKTPYVEGMMPEFLQHLDVRFVEPNLPYMGGDEALIGGYVRFPEDEASDGHTLALLDAWPCPTLCKLSGPFPASTVTWTVHFLAPPQPGFHRYRYETISAAVGFSTAAGHLWNRDGQLAAYSEQTVAVFDGPR